MISSQAIANENEGCPMVRMAIPSGYGAPLSLGKDQLNASSGEGQAIAQRRSILPPQQAQLRLSQCLRLGELSRG